MAEAEARKRTPPPPEVLATDGRTDGEERRRERGCHPGKLAGRSQKREAESDILPHVTVIGEYDFLAPVAGLGRILVRATAIHTLLSLSCVMIVEGTVRMLHCN